MGLYNVCIINANLDLSEASKSTLLCASITPPSIYGFRGHRLLVRYISLYKHIENYYNLSYPIIV